MILSTNWSVFVTFKPLWLVVYHFYNTPALRIVKVDITGQTYYWPPGSSARAGGYGDKYGVMRPRTRRGMLSNVGELHLIKSFSVADNKMRPGQIRTFRKVWKKGFFCAFAHFCLFLTLLDHKISGNFLHFRGRGAGGLEGVKKTTLFFVKASLNNKLCPSPMCGTIAYHLLYKSSIVINSHQ